MTPAEYRAKASWHLHAAERESDSAQKAEHLSLAHSYNRLAQMAEKNAATDVVYETSPPRAPQPQAQAQQQQQIQPKPKTE